MKRTIQFIALCAALASTNAFAVQVETKSNDPSDSKSVALVEQESSFSYEFHAEAAYFGSGDVERGEHGNLNI